MKPSLAFTLGVLFFQTIPLLEARQLRLDADKEEHPHLSLLPHKGTSKETGEALVVDYVEPEWRSSGGEEEVTAGATDDALYRPAGRSPPSPQGSNPPHYRQPAGRWGSGPWSGWVGGSRTPSRPPAPSGKNPPHWRSSGDRLSPRPVDVFHVLRVLTKMFC